MKPRAGGRPGRAPTACMLLVWPPACDRPPGANAWAAFAATPWRRSGLCSQHALPGAAASAAEPNTQTGRTRVGCGGRAGPHCGRQVQLLDARALGIRRQLVHGLRIWFEGDACRWQRAVHVGPPLQNDGDAWLEAATCAACGRSGVACSVDRSAAHLALATVASNTATRYIYGWQGSRPTLAYASRSATSRSCCIRTTARGLGSSFAHRTSSTSTAAGRSGLWIANAPAGLLGHSPAPAACRCTCSAISSELPLACRAQARPPVVSQPRSVCWCMAAFANSALLRHWYLATWTRGKAGKGRRVSGARGRQPALL